MQYKFFATESKIIDLITFPECLRFSEKKSRDLDIDYYNDYILEDTFEYYEALATKLKPFEKEINRFYFSNLSMPVMLTKLNSFFGYDSVDSYLNKLKNLTQDELLKSFLTKIYASITENDKILHAEDIYDDVTKYMKDKNKQIDLLEQLDANDEEKWKISSLLRQPKTMTNEWISLIETLIPLFENEYKLKESKIIEFGKFVEKKLNDSNGDALPTMTDNLLNKKLLPSGNILISFINSYALEINTSDKTPYLRWGIDVEDFLELIQNAKENELKDRVLLFKNLGDKTRYEVIKLIAQGATSAKEIATTLNVSQATISYHLNNLISSKLLILERDNSKYSHKINFDILESAYKSMIADFTPNQNK